MKASVGGLLLVVVVSLVQVSFTQGFVPGYSLDQVQESTWGFTGQLSQIPGSEGPYGGDIATLTLQVFFQTENIVRIKITDPNNARWEVPDVVQFNSPAIPPPASTNYRVSYTSSPFGIAVSRVGVSGAEGVVFNTSSPDSGVQFNGLIYEDQYLEWSSQLPSNPNIYGLGERVDHFKLPTDDQDYVMWNRDQGTPYDTNLYGTHPMYMEIRQTQTIPLAHGIFFLNTNAMNVHLQSGAMTFQTIGGVIDVFVVLGPSPYEVIEQYTSIIGRPHFPPFWELGFHQCRWGYQSIQETASVALNYKRFLIPLDTMWNDIDYMDAYRDFTHDPVYYPTDQVAQFVEYLHNNHQQYVVIIDPGIMVDPEYFSYVQGLQEDIFIKESTGKKNLIGTVWPGDTVFPDFSNPKAEDYWKSQIFQFRSTGVTVDGLWIDMNEISNFCNGECVITDPDQYTIQNDPYDNPPWYPTAQALNTSTISMNAITYAGINYNTHDLYAFFEARATNQALEQLRGQRSFVLSRSSFAGSGKYTSCWLGDNTSDWDDLYYSIAGILSYQMFGIPMVGVDICGFNGNTTEELCSRWMQLGAFYPFSRNHNSIDMIPQEPWAFDSLQHIEITRNALNLRYTLLPYFYTLVYEAATLGSTIWSALIWEFPADPNCLDIDAQFLVGPGILVTPVLQANQSSVTGYFPAAVWYDFYSGARLGSTSAGSYVQLDAPIKKIPIALRGGVIIPTQLPALTTHELRSNPFVLLVSLDQAQQAAGYVFLDDGVSLYTVEQNLYTIVEFSCTSSVLSGKVAVNGYDISSLVLAEVKVFGVDFSVTSIVVNGVTTYHNFRYDPDSQILLISGLVLPLASSWEIYWV